MSPPSHDDDDDCYRRRTTATTPGTRWTTPNHEDHERAGVQGVHKNTFSFDILTTPTDHDSQRTVRRDTLLVALFLFRHNEEGTPLLVVFFLNATKRVSLVALFSFFPTQRGGYTPPRGVFSRRNEEGRPSPLRRFPFIFSTQRGFPPRFIFQFRRSEEGKSLLVVSCFYSLLVALCPSRWSGGAEDSGHKVCPPLFIFNMFILTF